MEYDATQQAACSSSQSSAPHKPRAGLEHKEGMLGSNSDVCTRELRDDIRQKFCSPECELGRLFPRASRDVYNIRFSQISAGMGYFPLPDLRADERVADSKYSDAQREEYYKTVQFRTEKQCQDDDL